MEPGNGYIRNIHRHWLRLANAPPTRGLTTPATLQVLWRQFCALHMKEALSNTHIPNSAAYIPLSFRGTRSARTIAERACIPPPPIPCTVLPAMRVRMFPATAHMTDPTRKKRMQARIVGRLPTTCAAPPLMGSIAVEASIYADPTHTKS